MNISLKEYRDLLATYLKPQWRKVLLLGVLLSASISLQLLNPQILRGFIDQVRAGAAPQSLTQSALLFLGIAMAAQLTSVAETYLAENIGWIATNRLRADLALHCLQLDLSFHNARTPGELIERVDGDVATLGNFFARFVVQVLGNGILLVGVLVQLFAIDGRVGLTLSAFTLLVMVVMMRLRNVAVPYWTLARQASANLFGFLEERLSGTEDIRANGATAYVMRRLAELSRHLLRTERTARLVGGATWNITTFLFTLGAVLALALGASLFLAGSITLGTVYLIFAYTDLLNRPIGQINRQLQDLQQASAGISRVQALFSMQSAIREGAGVPLSTHALAVEFEAVGFAYGADERRKTTDSRGSKIEDRGSKLPAQAPAELDAEDAIPDPRSSIFDLQPSEQVLQGISFRLEAGKVLGLLGRTGSGKTSLIRLLFRLYDPTQGVIRLDGVDLRDLRLADIRNRIGIVTQDIQLFHASVRDNLTFFERTIADHRICAVLQDLGLWSWYQTLPQGLDTKLAPGQSGLSAGEAQLLAFARVFLKDPGLVILDEASSRLDPATEAQVERAVDRLLQGRTGIIIAHRLATVGRADTIMILEQGRIHEYGARQCLARDSHSHFAQMLRTGMEEVLA